MIVMNDNKLVSVSAGVTGDTTQYFRDIFNMPLTFVESGKEEITIIPLYECRHYMYVSDVYVNYEKLMLPGQKIVDQNGNKFISLGGLLLYKYE